MPRLPRLKGKDLLRAFGRAGFVTVRVKGSHHVLEHSDGRKTVIPIHTGEVIGPGLLSKILADAELSAHDLRNLLR